MTLSVVAAAAANRGTNLSIGQSLKKILLTLFGPHYVGRLDADPTASDRPLLSDRFATDAS